MKLSVCVITKNEEKNIARCLESIKSIATEIIVVDTGSTDDTVSIAKKQGAKTYYFKWVNDFSKARNYALSKATGNWILFLDADEYLSKDSIPRIKPILKLAKNIKAQVITSLLNNYEKSGNRFLGSLNAQRLFRKDQRIYYVGAIHETIVHSSNKSLKVLDATDKLQIIHTGYSLEDRQEKNKGKRNLKLLFQELEKDPGNGFLHFYISESLASIGRYKDAVEHANKALEGEKLPKHLKPKNYRNIIYLMFNLKYDQKDILHTIDRAIIESPDSPDIYYILAKMLKGKNQINDAIEAYELVLKNVANAFKFQSSAVGYMKDVYQSLAELYYKIEQVPKSVENYVKVLKIDLNDLPSLKGLLRILERFEATEEIIKFLGHIYNYKDIKHLLILLQTSLQINNKTLSSIYFSYLSHPQQLRLKKESAYIQFLNGDYQKCSIDFKDLFLVTHEYETSVFCIVAAELANNKKVLKEIAGDLYPSLGKIVKIILGATDVEIFEEDYNGIFKIINQYIKLGRIDKLVYILEQLPKAKWIHIADILFKYEKYDSALDIYYQYFEYENDIPSKDVSAILTKMGECVYKLGDYKLSIQFFEDAMNLNPLEYKNYELAIIALKRIGEQNKIDEMAFKASKYFPKSNFLRNRIQNKEFLNKVEDVKNTSIDSNNNEKSEGFLNHTSAFVVNKQM